MWAGGRLTFHRDLRISQPIERCSTVADIAVKEGRSGTLIFVLVRHDRSGLAISEKYDIVYREAPRPGDPALPGRPVPEGGVWQRDVVPDPVLLFRYSALTFDGHRIHYDRSDVTRDEGYPGLVVRGPLVATLLADLVRRNSALRHRANRLKSG